MTNTIFYHLIRGEKMEFIKKNPKIYIFAGKARAGKDTSADILKKYYEQNNKKTIILQYSFYLKEYAKKITGWDGSDENKPRQLLIDLGTGLIRNQINHNFFVDRMIQDIEIYSYYFDVIIISDARLVEELDCPKTKLKNVKLNMDFFSIIKPLRLEIQAIFRLFFYFPYGQRFSFRLC